MKKLINQIKKRTKILLPKIRLLLSKTKLIIRKLKCKYILRLPLNDISLKRIPEYKKEDKNWRKKALKGMVSMSKYIDKYLLPLPELWRYSTQGNTLYITHWDYEKTKENKPLESFVLLCKKIEDLGNTLNKTFITDSLNASCYIKYNGSEFTLFIIQGQIDKCEIEYESQIVKVPKLKGFCAEAIK